MMQFALLLFVFCCHFSVTFVVVTPFLAASLVETVQVRRPSHAIILCVVITDFITDKHRRNCVMQCITENILYIKMFPFITL